MQIFIKIVKGQSFAVEVEASDSILMLKQKILALQSIPIKQQLLVSRSRWLDNNFSLQHYNIQAGSTINWLVQLAYNYL
jgi:hypothetical protein